MDFITYQLDTSETVVDGSLTVWRGIVSSNSITSLSRTSGAADAGNAVNDYVEMVPTGYGYTKLVEGLLVSHNQTGAIDASSTASFQSNIDINDSSTAIRDSSDNELVKFAKTASAVNELTVTNAATGTAPTLSATGGDSNIDLKLSPKGTGRVVLNGAGAPSTAIVATGESTSSTTYTDLATSGPAVTVTIGASGSALVIVGANKLFNGGTGESHMSFAVSGASTQAAADNLSFGVQASSANLPQVFGSASFLVTGLTAGSNTFTAKYRATSSSLTAQDRRITVIPL